MIWVDIGAGDVHRFDPATGTDDVVAIGSPVGAVAPRSDGGLVLVVEDAFAPLDTGSDEAAVVAPVDHGPGPVTRMNVGKCDVRGRFWAGSMAYDCSPGHGALYRLDQDLTVTRVLDGVTISNGSDWSDDGHVLYFIDSLAGGSFWDLWSRARTPGVDAFDVDDAGGLSGRRRCFDIPIQDGVPAGMTVPDGMTMDREGMFWVAVPGDGEVRRYTPDGTVEAVVRLPVACPTSVAFGGDDLADLYISTMTPHGAPGPDPRKPSLMWQPKPSEGALFKCRPGPTGPPPAHLLQIAGPCARSTRRGPRVALPRLVQRLQSAGWCRSPPRRPGTCRRSGIRVGDTSPPG